MISYKDRTFCLFWKECLVKDACSRALTPDVINEAIKWFGDKNIIISQFIEKPSCFKLDAK